MGYDLVALQNYGLPAELATEIAELQDNFGDSFGESFSRISLKGNRFSLKSGNVAEMISADKLDCVILGDAPTDHCTYYAGKYDPNQEDVKPTAVWLQGRTCLRSRCDTETLRGFEITWGEVCSG